jgi:chemotaxis family two-component system response regulator Rcp1
MLHILLAEDNLGDVLLVRRALDEHRIAHELHVVKDGGEAVNFVTHMGEPGGAPCPDVFLLDLNLPKVDGAEILTQFRKHPACAHTPVIAVSSSDMPKDRTQMAALGVDRYFKKPSNLTAFLELGALVRDVVTEKKREE